MDRMDFILMDPIATPSPMSNATIMIEIHSRIPIYKNEIGNRGDIIHYGVDNIGWESHNNKGFLMKSRSNLS